MGSPQVAEAFQGRISGSQRPRVKTRFSCFGCKKTDRIPIKRAHANPVCTTVHAHSVWVHAPSVLACSVKKPPDGKHSGKAEPMPAAPRTHPNDPLHGITLQSIPSSFTPTTAGRSWGK